MTDPLLTAGIAGAILLGLLNLILLLRRPPATTAIQAEAQSTRDALAIAQRMLESSHRAETEALRTHLTNTERALAHKAETQRLEAQQLLGALTERLVRDQADQRTLLETKLREMAEHAAIRLAAIQASVNEQLAKSIETQMQTSFQRVIDQFDQVQKAMVDVQAVTSQIGDLKRLFSNVKTRGGWGEAQLRAMLEDMLPQGAWEANRKLDPATDEAVEFVLLMPSRETPRPLLAIDAKFPAEDYDRLIQASETNDPEAEKTARRNLEQTLRTEAKKIANKYIRPPTTVDFAIMYLPTDGLYVEAAKMPGLLESLNRDHHVLIMGPTLLPALIRTIQLGALTLSIEQKAEEIRRILGAVRTEFAKMDTVLARLEKQASTVTNTITDARSRTRAMDRTLRSVEALDGGDTTGILKLESVITPLKE